MSQRAFKAFSFYTDEDRTFRYVRDKLLGPVNYCKVMDSIIENSTLNVSSIKDNLWMKKNQVVELAKNNHIIGLHSHSHPTEIKSLPIDKQEDEYQMNYNILTRDLGLDIYTMSHPCNSYNEDTKAVLKGLNVNFGFRANMETGYNSF